MRNFVKIFFILNVIVFNISCKKNPQIAVATKENKFIHEKSSIESQLSSNESNKDVVEVTQTKDRSNILKYLPKNYSKEGEADYTIYLQNAVNENKEVILPNFPIAVNYQGLQIPSNRKIEFQDNSRLVMIPNDKKNYQAIMLDNVENVQLINPVIIGDRDKHVGKGEWGMGISILSSKNVYIKNINISNSFGDGIYIARNLKTKIIPEKIVIEGGVLENNRRNGISVISAENLKIFNLAIRNNHKELPLCGIDIEPNNNQDIIDNIIIENINTSNGNIGVQVGIRNLPSLEQKDVNILINNIESNSDNYGVLMGDLFRRNKYPIDTKILTGKIEFKNIKVNNSKKEPIKYFSPLGYEYAPKVAFSQILIDGNKISTKIEKEIKARNFSISY